MKSKKKKRRTTKLGQTICLLAIALSLFAIVLAKGYKSGEFFRSQAKVIGKSKAITKSVSVTDFISKHRHFDDLIPGFLYEVKREKSCIKATLLLYKTNNGEQETFTLTVNPDDEKFVNALTDMEGSDVVINYHDLDGTKDKRLCGPDVIYKIQLLDDYYLTNR